jgi:hypothetical protein
MLNLPWLGRRDVPPIEDASLAALLSGAEVPDLAAGLQPVADVLAALRARPARDELAGEAVAMAEFRDRVGVSDPVQYSRRRRPALLTSLMSAKVAGAAIAVAIAVGGVATAAYAGALPSPAQQVAHEWIGAPAAHNSHPFRLSAGHGAKPPAAPAPCAAYRRASVHGTAAQKAAAYQRLVTAAGGADKIAAYCRVPRRRPHQHVPHPSCWSAGPRPSRSPKPGASWSPSPRPSWSPSPRPSWSPRPAASLPPAPRPSCTPFPHPSGTPRPHRHRIRPHRPHKHIYHHPRKPGPGPYPTPSASASPGAAMPTPRA